MDRGFFRELSVALIAVPIATSATSEVTPLAPTSAWTVDFADSECLASRNYGTADKPLLLMFKPSVTEGTTQMLIVRTGQETDPTEYPVLLSTGSGKPMRATALDYGLNKPSRRVRSIVLTPSQMGVLASASHLDITSAAPDYHFELRQMAAIQAKLGECMIDLFKHWQMSPEDQARVVQRATANLRGIFSDDDYPSQAEKENNSGSVSVRLLIETTGKVADCSILETSGSAVLDLQTCFILRDRAKFKPALDKDGKPLRAFYRQRVNWRM